MKRRTPTPYLHPLPAQPGCQHVLLTVEVIPRGTDPMWLERSTCKSCGVLVSVGFRRNRPRYRILKDKSLYIPAGEALEATRLRLLKTGFAHLDATPHRDYEMPDDPENVRFVEESLGMADASSN